MLELKTKFKDSYLQGGTEPVDPALPGDIVSYHMPDTVVHGETGDVAVVVDLTNRAGGLLLSAAATFLLYRMTPLRGVLWNAMAICAPPACDPKGEALASAEAHAPKGASPSGCGCGGWARTKKQGKLLWLSAAGCAPLSQRSVAEKKEKGQGFQHGISVATSENAFSSCIASSSGELTCPRGNPAEKRFLLSAAAFLLYRMTPLRGVLWNAIAICLNTWHECAPPACAPEGEALASAEAHAPKGASPSPRPETPTRRHPPMHAQLTPHLGLGSSVIRQEKLVQ